MANKEKPATVTPPAKSYIITPMEPFRLPGTNCYIVDKTHPNWKSQCDAIKNR